MPKGESPQPKPTKKSDQAQPDDTQLNESGNVPAEQMAVPEKMEQPKATTEATVPEPEHTPITERPENTLVSGLGINLAEIAAQMKAAEETLARENISEEKAKELLAQYDQAHIKLAELKAEREEQIAANQHNPFEELAVNNYTELADLDLMSADDAETLKKVEDMIAQLKEKGGNRSSQDEKNFNAFKQFLNETQTKLNSKLIAKRDERSQANQAKQKELAEHYDELIATKLNEIEDLEKYDAVQMGLQRRERSAERQAEQEAQEKNKGIELSASRVETLQNQAADKINSVLGDKEAFDKLVAALDLPKTEKRVAFNQVRNDLVEVIMLGTGDKKIFNPRDVNAQVRYWKIGTNPKTSQEDRIDYGELRGMLRNDENRKFLRSRTEIEGERGEKAQALRDKIALLEKRDGVFTELFGDRKTKADQTRSHTDKFWQAFGLRRRIDQGSEAEAKQILDRYNKERAAQVAQDKKMADIVKAGGFYLTFPTRIETINSRQMLKGAALGAIKLEVGDKEVKITDIVNPSSKTMDQVGKVFDIDKVPFYIRIPFGKILRAQGNIELAAKIDPTKEEALADIASREAKQAAHSNVRIRPRSTPKPEGQKGRRMSAREARNKSKKKGKKGK